MIQNGWKIDLPYPEDDDPYSAYQSCGGDSFFGYPGAYREGRMSAIFRKTGNASLSIGNCRDKGTVVVSLNKTELETIRANGKTTVEFTYHPTDVLEIQTDNDAIIKLYDLQLSCKGTCFLENKNLKNKKAYYAKICYIFVNIYLDGNLYLLDSIEIIQSCKKSTETTSNIISTPILFQVKKRYILITFVLILTYLFCVSRGTR